jgi:transcriptional regulator with XRE-family HTH domain
MIERQENSPTVAMVERIARALGIEPARLFDERAAGRKGSKNLIARMNAAICG